MSVSIEDLLKNILTLEKSELHSVCEMPSGSFADIFLANYQDESVIVKALKKEHMGNVNFVHKFVDEYKFLETIYDNYPDESIKVFELALSLDDQLIIIMEKAEKTFSGAFFRKLNPSQQMECLVGITKALKIVHDSGIIHSDIKTDNILIMGNGEYRVCDFGLAKALDHEDKKELKNTSYEDDKNNKKRNPAFRAPEAINYNYESYLSDLYSLGVVFYECFTEKFPIEPKVFEKESVKFHSPLKHNEEMMQSVASVICHLLHPEKGKRYQSADELLLDLEQIQQKMATVDIDEDLYCSLTHEFVLSEDAIREESNQKSKKIPYLILLGIMGAVVLLVFLLKKSDTTNVTHIGEVNITRSNNEPQFFSKGKKDNINESVSIPSNNKSPNEKGKKILKEKIDISNRVSFEERDNLLLVSLTPESEESDMQSIFVDSLYKLLSDYLTKKDYSPKQIDLIYSGRKSVPKPDRLCWQFNLKP